MCDMTRYPISDDELLRASIMPMVYRCFTCGFTSKGFDLFLFSFFVCVFVFLCLLVMGFYVVLC